MGKTASTLQNLLSIRDTEGEHNVVDALYAIAQAIEHLAVETERETDAIDYLTDVIKKKQVYFVTKLEPGVSVPAPSEENGNDRVDRQVTDDRP